MAFEAAEEWRQKPDEYQPKWLANDARSRMATQVASESEAG